MAKKKAQVKAASKPHHLQQHMQQQVGSTEQDDVLFDLSDPDEFRKAFIASEILNRKY